MVERLFLAVPWGCLQFVIVVSPDHTHLLFLIILTIYKNRQKSTGVTVSSSPDSFSLSERIDYSVFSPPSQFPPPILYFWKKLEKLYVSFVAIIGIKYHSETAIFAFTSPIARLVTSVTADPGVSASLILARSHTLVESDHEILSTAILLSSTDPRKVFVSYK